MAIIEIRGGPITRKYLEKKSKFDLITEYLRLLERIQEQDGLIKSLQSQLSKATQEAEHLRKERDRILRSKND